MDAMYLSARKWLVRVGAATVTDMARGRVLGLALLCAAWVLGTADPAEAGVSSRRSHRVTSGESLWTIARANRCTVDDLRRANRLRGDGLLPGQKLRIPRCGARAEDERAARRARARKDARETAADRAAREARDPDAAGRDPYDGDRAEVIARLEARSPDRLTDMGVPEEEPIDPGASWAIDEVPQLDRRAHPGDSPPVVAMIDPAAVDRLAEELDRKGPEESMGTLDRGREEARVGVGVPLVGQSFGRPQSGYLVSGTRMPTNAAAYFLRRPERAFGTRSAVGQVVSAIRAVRRKFPRVHPLAIGDFSARHGGPLSMHGSHQSGRDADIGFYFRKKPRSYPRSFAVATADNIDFPATWALISALLRGAGKPGGVERIYLTYQTQALFYRLARRHKVPRARLDEWFQYPHGRRAARGVIRHWPGHTEHIHVRFRCAADDPECR